VAALAGRWVCGLEPVSQAPRLIELNLQAAAEQVHDVLAEVKPRLRGWLHLGAIPLTLAVGAVLVSMSPTATTRVGSSVFVGSALALFTVSAAYHCGTWSARTTARLRRLDHATIFLLIAGSYTGYTLLLLTGEQRVGLLALVWAGAFLGIVFRVCWVGAPRWLHTPLYVALGWSAVLFSAGFRDGAERLGSGTGLATLLMLAAGGTLYTLGGVVYGFQRPNPWPRWFGFHEVFHALTILAFVAHLAGLCLATLSMR
jgi:hemolysin III